MTELTLFASSFLVVLLLGLQSLNVNNGHFILAALTSFGIDSMQMVMFKLAPHATLTEIATCIGCGCTDHHACPGGCTWLRVDYDLRAGVCSRCQTYLPAWDAGRRVRCFQPTNGTVGESVLADWCGTCELGKDGPCIIAANTMLYRDTDPEYPQEWRYDTAGYPGCVAYVQLGLPVMPTRCDRTEDMFEEGKR